MNDNNNNINNESLLINNTNENYYYCGVSEISTTLVCGDNCTLIISTDRNIYSFGCNIKCMLGFSHIDVSILLTQISSLSEIKMVYCGSYHTVCLDFNGNVYTFGGNNDGQLGINKDSNSLLYSHIPQKLNLPSIQQISCGDKFTVCLSDEGFLYSFGSNNKGQLGVGDNDNIIFPQHIKNIENVVLIECGSEYCICIQDDGSYYSWGDNQYGQLGIGNNDSSNKPILCLAWPDNITSVKCGKSHSLFLTNEGKVYSCGSNFNGKLGIDDKFLQIVNYPVVVKGMPEIQRIECGHGHSMCMDVENNLWCFGYNYYGQLGLGDIDNRYKPTLNMKIGKIIDMSYGGYHSFVKTKNNKIYTFGNNNYSQLGLQSSIDRLITPTQIFKDSEDVWCTIYGKSTAKSARK